MFLVDFEQGRIIDDEELKGDMASRQPWQQRVREQLPPLDVGQFAGVTEPRPKEIERALRVASST